MNSIYAIMARSDDGLYVIVMVFGTMEEAEKKLKEEFPNGYENRGAYDEYNEGYDYEHHPGHEEMFDYYDGGCGVPKYSVREIRLGEKLCRWELF